jgi:hypothetical protein
MKREDAVALVVKGLSSHQSKNEIIRVLCEKTGMPWSVAEDFVKQVEDENGKTIAAKQSPFLIVLGVVISLVGLGLMLNATQYFINVAQTDAMHIALSAQGLYYRVGSFVSGFFMLAGGLIGLRQPILALFEGMESSSNK